MQSVNARATIQKAGNSLHKSLKHAITLKIMFAFGIYWFEITDLIIFRLGSEQSFGVS